MTAEQLTLPTTKEGFFKLPRGAQYLVAYALFNDMWQIQLLRNDPDMQALVGAGWLAAKPSTTHGIVNCDFPESVWAAMENIEEDIYGSVTEEEMDRYKARKSKAYPWLW